MITAKNLQLLDTQGNNISPAVNIETIYYEQTVGNVVHRNHIFKHFPVYVKYNGKPAINYEGTILVDDTFYQNTIVPYEEYVWPSIANVAVTDIYKDNQTFDASLGGDVLLLEYTNPTPNDIYVAGIRQTPLGNGTDFMRLDISTYNLTDILKPVAYKDWVNVRLDYYNTKIDNSDIYDSKLKKTTELADLTIYAPIGGLTEKVLFDTLNGLKYTELFDKLLLGPVKPKVSDCVINLGFNPKILITDTMLETYHNQVNKNQASYIYNKITSNVQCTTDISIINFEMSALSKPNKNIILPYIIKELKFLLDNTIKSLSIEYNTETEKYETTKKAYKYKLTLPWNLYQMRQHLYAKLSTPVFVYNDKVNINNKVCDSLGRPIEDITTVNDILDKTVNRIIINCNDEEIYKKALPKLEDGKYEATIYDNIRMSDITVNFPVKYGDNINKLKTTYVSACKFNKIQALWNPVKPFYICVPRIVVGQLINPIPSLYRLFQASRWQISNNWNISQVTSFESTTDEYLDAYITYIVEPIGVGAKKLVLFALNLSVSNLLENKKRMSQKTANKLQS